VKRLLVVLVFCLPAAAGQGSIDFTPHVAEQTLAGIVFKQLIFHENDKKIAYEQPRGWSYSADAARLRMTPPDVGQAQGEIDQSPLPKPQNFDEETVKALQQRILDSVANAQKMRVVGEQLNPVVINGHETYEVTVEYELYGQQFAASVIFMNLPDTQVRFRVSARKQDFEKVQKAFRASLYSWQWL
jgi:hypothetical protein